MNKKKFIKWILFIIYALVNLALVLYHEPWRDEIHAWLMAKEYSIQELFLASKFDGHPILWHLLLMPFAKLNFPIITLNIISYVVMLIAVWFFIFKTDLPMYFKIIVVLTIPFTYVYSAVSRNYCLIILILMIIAVLYNKRYEKPILYSILIALLIHTHSLSWGIVAGLTITFHFYEILLFFKHKNKADIKKTIIGLAIIVINTILVVLELYGSSNQDYNVRINSDTIYVIKTMIYVFTACLIITIINKKNIKELIIVFCSFAFQILIYTCYYSSILLQRFELVFAIFLFFIIIINKDDFKKYIKHLIYMVFLLFILFSAGRFFKDIIIDDIKYPNSSAKEMAEYINNNLPENETILIDASIIGQTIIPYLNTARFYDITYNQYVDCANVSHDVKRIYDAIVNLNTNKYSGYYLIICNDFVVLDFPVVYKTKHCIKDELYTLYYIP